MTGMLAVRPFRATKSGWVYDDAGHAVVYCDGCGLLYSDAALYADPHFICACGRLGQRMEYATPEQCGPSAPAAATYRWRVTWVPEDPREAPESVDVTGSAEHAVSAADAGPPSEYAVRESVIERRGAAHTGDQPPAGSRSAPHGC